ncbi:hypothetical protein LguiB_018021 [Lonicera macranthoides]
MGLGLNLSLNYQEVLDAWSNRGSLRTVDFSLSSTANNAYMGEVPVMEEEKIRREVRVLRYKEKRQSRLFSKKIIYQVRKLNADKRPRLKVKNNIVRAPCGVMDQMTSAYCEANQLLAMVCQSTANGMNPDELEDNYVEMLEAEASLDYLCNVAPHR